jgi:hypothetical protein
MTPDFNYDRLPAGFAYCFAHDCKQADTCMCSLATSLIPVETEAIRAINPARVRPNGDDCPYYEKDAPVRFALGMKNLFDKVENNRLRGLKNDVIRVFGTRNYYRCAKGDRYITPEEQRSVARLFRQYGIDEAPVFDRYVERYAWEKVRISKE